MSYTNRKFDIEDGPTDSIALFICIAFLFFMAGMFTLLGWFIYHLIQVL